MSEIETQMTELSAAIRELASVRAETAPGAKAQDGGRHAAAADASVATAQALTAAAEAKASADNAKLREEWSAIAKEAVKAALLDVRSPSLAAAIGNPAIEEQARVRFQQDASPALKASLGDKYQGGDLLTAIMEVGTMQGDHVAGKAALAKLGLFYMSAPEGKATLGTTGATGGYVLPNNLVATLEKPNTQVAVYTGPNPLVTVISGVMVRGIDQPYRTGAPAAMTAQNWGATKTNVDEAYGSYTATLGTFAKIYDIGKQYARFSAGAAEQDVIDELTKSAALAENKAVIAGPGTGSATPGVNDPTKGVYTSLLGNVYTTAATASSSTVAGSGAAALAAGFSALASRSRYPNAAVLDAVTYWTLFSQGSDSAGFWMSDLLGAGFAIGADNALRWRGVPIYFDANLTTNAASKIAIVGEWKALKFYRGMEFRVDSSDVAGDRWDKNLIGFRGEEEFGVNADTAVAVGAFQLITGVIP
jgi:HK97 family phage major capsid protein